MPTFYICTQNRKHLCCTKMKSLVKSQSDQPMIQQKVSRRQWCAGKCFITIIINNNNNKQTLICSLSVSHCVSTPPVAGLRPPPGHCWMWHLAGDRGRVVQLDFIKVKNFCCVKDTSHRLPESVCKNTSLAKDLYPKYTKNSPQTQQ